MYNPFKEMKKIQNEMNKLFANNFMDGFRDFNINEQFSSLREDEDELIFRINLPGIKKEDIQLLINENTLEVKVEKKSELKIKKKNYSREESSYKGFHKVMSLPCKIIPEDVESNYKDGILEIKMPKAEKKKLRKIEIK